MRRPDASGAGAPDLLDRGIDGEDFRRAALAGLSAPQKQIPCKFLYDERGSELFEAICDLEAYYPTRTELALLEGHREEIAAALPPRPAIVDLGSGSSRKLDALVRAVSSPAAYVPVDISRDYLETAAARVAERYPELPVHPVCADYTRALELPEAAYAHPALLFFPGSTIGNFGPAEAEPFLRRLRDLAAPGGAMLIGVDTKKDASVLEAAYDDPEGVTARFNTNLLARLNRELGADFDLGAFFHRAVYAPGRGCVEMHIVSRRDQEVTVAGERFTFGAGETIHTEDSFKYAPDEFSALAARAGWDARARFLDDRGYFSVHLLAARAGDRSFGAAPAE